ncbi:DUF2459 domain-containing protein [Erythrobacter sp. YT30]|uniref:DUF2459 domain-containing protein n=1 Tax=Erythrobacter sp. YT30 TaxID=1735012 RepID=UPI00076BFA6F|nr:DUF2459 domain-containing protein [Erythrobacter sp. YT30]KWV93137.1 hypothetical protein AUC45_03170 [Erythrobacter sp. YT30]
MPKSSFWWKAVRRTFAAILAIIAIAGLAGWIGSSIPRGDPLLDAPADPVEIMIATNGVHTEIVVPVVNSTRDWREILPSVSKTASGDVTTHIAIGFGERDVFINTPTFYDMRLSTALRVATTGGEGMIRVINLTNPGAHQNRRKLTISREQYARLVNALEDDLPPLAAGEARTFETSTYDRGRYYASPQRYTLITTCNQWTSDRLANAGIRTGWLTPFSGGVMKWVPKPNAVRKVEP